MPVTSLEIDPGDVTITFSWQREDPREAIGDGVEFVHQVFAASGIAERDTVNVELELIDHEAAAA